MGRPKKNQEDHLQVFNLRMLPIEAEKLKKKAEKNGMRFSPYCRMLLLTRKPIVYGEGAEKLTIELKNIGVNFNQMVKELNIEANKGNITPHDIDDYLEKAYGFLHSIKQEVRAHTERQQSTKNQE